MNYQESLPSPKFANWIKCFWSLEYRGSGDGEPEIVVPDGCIEIVFNLWDRFRRFHPTGAIETQSTTLVAGQMHASIVIAPTGNVRLFGIRFKPAGAFPFFRFGLDELTDRVDPLELIWGRKVVARFEDQLSRARSFEGQIALTEAALSEQLSERHPFDPSLNEAIERIASANGMARVSRVAKEIGISERGLQRRFRDLVGLSPKSFSRVVRFQSVLKKLESPAPPDLVDIALSHGYYDQSHLVNDFREFSSLSPTAYMERAHRMAELFTMGE